MYQERPKGLPPWWSVSRFYRFGRREEKDLKGVDKFFMSTEVSGALRTGYRGTLLGREKSIGGPCGHTHYIWQECRPGSGYTFTQSPTTTNIVRPQTSEVRYPCEKVWQREWDWRSGSAVRERRQLTDLPWKGTTDTTLAPYKTAL